MNVTTARLTEARAIAAELGIADAYLDDSGLGSLITAARNPNHLRTLIRTEAAELALGGDDATPAAADAATPASKPARTRKATAPAEPADDEDDDDQDDPHAYTDFHALVAEAIAHSGTDSTFRALSRLAGRPVARASRANRQPRGAAALRYSKGVDPELLPAGTVRARLHKDGDASAVLAVVKLDQTGAERANYKPTTADEADYGWAIVCLAHGTTSLQKTRRDARRLTMTPAKFCTGCAGH